MYKHGWPKNFACCIRVLHLSHQFPICGSPMVVHFEIRSIVAGRQGIKVTLETI